MEKIGDFSKRCEVTIKTLRYYDDIGLLTPDYIDKFTGYRYYTLEKVAEMQRITELKNIGFSLDEIKLFCSADSEDKKHQILREKRQSLEKLSIDVKKQLRELTKLEQKSTKLKGEKQMKNNVNMPFVNDETVIGRWEIIASVEKKEDFISSQNYKNESPFEEIYFLPDGEEYWGFGWTKDYIKITFGSGLLCPYELEKIDGKTYMFVHTDYREKIWVLKQTDNKKYTKYEIGRHDNINLPFVNDENVLGKWTCVDLVKEIDKFKPNEKQYDNKLFITSLEFLPDGQVKEQFNNGNPCNWKWTKGTTLIENGDGTTAPAYEIHAFDETDYLFLEWKTGDYIWGKMKPSYYVFKRG